MILISDYDFDCDGECDMIDTMGSGFSYRDEAGSDEQIETADHNLEMAEKLINSEIDLEKPIQPLEKDSLEDNPISSPVGSGSNGQDTIAKN